MRRVYLDIILPTVGRIKRAVEARHRADIAAMLRALAVQAQHEPRRWELLWELKDGRRRLDEVFAVYQAGRLAELPALELTGDLAAAVAAWAAALPASPRHRLAVQDALRTLAAQLRRPATLGDLPRLLARYRTACAERPRTFNLARAAALAFVRDTLGRRHSLYGAVQDVRPLTERRQGKPGLALADAVALRDRLPPRAARAWWALCLTGMNPAEYFGGRWEVAADRVRIRGTKRLGRRWGAEARDVPLVDHVTRPEVSLAGLTLALRRATAGAVVTPGQGRKTFARWAEDAGIPRTRRKLYLGHGARDVTDLYERHEITAFLAEDARRLRAQLDAGRTLRVVS